MLCIMKANHSPRHSDTRTLLLDAACAQVRKHGFASTSIGELCQVVGVTKGAFFHHFAGKEQLGVEAVRYWSDTSAAMFADAEYHRLPDPLDRILAYIDLRAALIDGEIEEFTCLAGTMVQETFATSDPIRLACQASILGHAATLEADLEATIEQYPPAIPVTARSLAVFIQAVLQGGFILAKAKNEPEAAKEAVNHLKAYFGLMFGHHKTNSHAPR
ncbi:MAG: TetR/AcrR family transcriptional regulator [Sphingorhabdus sp.]